MNVSIKYFASIREDMGISSEQLNSTATTLGQLRDQLIARGAPWDTALARGKAVRLALNQVMSDETAPLPPGAEVAFFPPVTGG